MATAQQTRLKVYQTSFDHAGVTYRVGDHAYMGDDRFLARVDTIYEEAGAGYVEGVWLYRARDIAPFVGALGRQPLSGEVFLSRDKCSNHRSFVSGKCTVTRRGDVPAGDVAAWAALPDHFFFELLFDSETKTFHQPDAAPQKEAVPAPAPPAEPAAQPKAEGVPPKVRVKVSAAPRTSSAVELGGEGATTFLRVPGCGEFRVGDHALFRTDTPGASPPVGRLTSLGRDAPSGGNVVVGVEWLARPADTPHEAEAALGELFATADFDVVPASSISGPVLVVHGDAPPASGGFFWRRTWDTSRATLTAPRSAAAASATTAAASPAQGSTSSNSHKRKPRPAPSSGSGAAATPPPSQKPRVARPSPEMQALARGKRPVYEFSVGPKRALVTYELTEGWFNEIAPRSAPSNRVDTYWYSPDGCKFRSTTEVLRHIQAKGWPLKIVSGKPPASNTAETAAEQPSPDNSPPISAGSTPVQPAGAAPPTTVAAPAAPASTAQAATPAPVSQGVPKVKIYIPAPVEQAQPAPAAPSSQPATAPQATPEPAVAQLSQPAAVEATAPGAAATAAEIAPASKVNEPAPKPEPMEMSHPQAAPVAPAAPVASAASAPELPPVAEAAAPAPAVEPKQEQPAQPPTSVPAEQPVAMAVDSGRLVPTEMPQPPKAEGDKPQGGEKADQPPAAQ